MPVDPQAQAIIDELTALNLPPYSETTPEQARRAVAAASMTLASGEPVAEVVERRIAGPAGEIQTRDHAVPEATPWNDREDGARTPPSDLSNVRN